MAAAAVLAGCFPSDPARVHPVAVRTTSSGEVEVLLVPCSPVLISRFEVTDPQEAFQSADDPRVWQVDFSPPATDLHRVTLGQVPPGGNEQVPWPSAGLDSRDPDKNYVVRVVLDNGGYWYQGFDQRHLTEGRILFRDRSISPEAFAEQSRCPDPTGEAG